MIEYVLFGSLKEGIEVILYFWDSTATKMSFADNCREIFPFLITLSINQWFQWCSNGVPMVFQWFTLSFVLGVNIGLLT